MGEWRDLMHISHRGFVHLCSLSAENDTVVEATWLVPDEIPPRGRPFPAGAVRAIQSPCSQTWSRLCTEGWSDQRGRGLRARSPDTQHVSSWPGTDLRALAQAWEQRGRGGRRRCHEGRWAVGQTAAEEGAAWSPEGAGQCRGVRGAHMGWLGGKPHGPRWGLILTTLFVFFKGGLSVADG